MYKEITTKSALHKLYKSRLPYSYDLNIYRGCIHKCKYCYALYSHKYIETDKNFFDEIYIKTNVAEILDKELSSKKWKKDIINLGGVCDSYQAIEAKYGITREILKVMLKHENPVIISTKSNLILRDFDIIKELASKTYVNIACTITVMDENIRKKIEPNTISSKERFEVLKKFKETNASVGVHMMPILPYITDNRENFDEIFKNSKEINADYVLTGLLNLIGDTKKHYLEFVRKEFPNLYQKYLNLYKNSMLKKEYSNNLYKMIGELKIKNKISSNYMKAIKEKVVKKDQMKLL